MISVRRLGRSTYGLSSPCYIAALHVAAKSIPGMRWNAPERTWCGYSDAVAATVVVLRKNAAQISISGEALLAEASEPPQNLSRIPSLSGLYDYQKEAVRFCLGHAEEGVILGLDMGLGKTLAALRTIRALKGERAVVVGPAFLSGVWEADAEKWKEPSVRVLKGTKPTPDQLDGAPQIVYCNYSIIHAWVPVLIEVGYRILVIDELHLLQGEKSRRAEALRKLRGHCVAALGLSGTPVPNRTRDLWLASDILSPGRFGKFFSFGCRYAAGHKEQVTPEKAVWLFDGRSHEEELAERLRHFMFRRTKAEVAKDLPPLTRQVIKLDVGRQSKGYASLVDAETARIDKKALRASLGAAADRKLPQVVEIIGSHVAAGNTVVVGTYRRVVAEHITDLLKASGVAGATYVHGGMLPEKRRAIIAKKPPVLCATIDSVGVGIDLSYANVGVVAELTYEPAEMAQFESRFHRRNQVRNVLIQFVLARGSIDELVCSKLIAKLETMEILDVSGDDGMLGDLKSTKNTEEVLSEMCRELLKELEEE